MGETNSAEAAEKKSISHTIQDAFKELGDRIRSQATDSIKVTDRKWLIDTLTRSTLFSDTQYANVTVHLKENEITLSVKSDVGLSSDQTIECVYPKSGDATKIILNYNLLIRLLSKLNDEDVVLNVAPDGDPVSVALYVNEGDVNFLLLPFMTN